MEARSRVNTARATAESCGPGIVCGFEFLTQERRGGDDPTVFHRNGLESLTMGILLSPKRRKEQRRRAKRFREATATETKVKSYHWDGERWRDQNGNPHPESLPPPT
jgi:hypothetical protein